MHEIEYLESNTSQNHELTNVEKKVGILSKKLPNVALTSQEHTSFEQIRDGHIGYQILYEVTLFFCSCCDDVPRSRNFV